MFHENLS
ncbi:hypothetical protein R3I93_020847 [Phoxinus phoxinus]